VITRELFEEWKKPPCFPTGISVSVRSSGSRRRFDYVDRESRTGMIAVDQMASEIRLAEQTAESGKDSLPIASDVVVALASPLGMTRERETKARANQS